MTPAQQELEWRACEFSCEYFLTHYWHIVGDEGVQLFTLREYQQELLADWLNEKYSLTLKARQLGITTLAWAAAFWEAFFHEDQLVIGLSRTREEASDIMSEKINFGYDSLPDWMKKRGPRRLSFNKLTIEFSNRSKIMSGASSSNPARGRTPTRVIADEVAFYKNGKEAWASIEPAIELRGRVNLFSTANGQDEVFYALWNGGDERFVRQFYPWSVVPSRSQAWYEERKKGLPPWQLAQEYPSSAEEAFVLSGRPVFDASILQQLPLKLPARRLRLERQAGGQDVLFLDDPQGQLQVWRMPEPQHQYVVGADVAFGLEHGDYSVAIVVDCETGEQVAKWRGHIDTDLFGTEILGPLGLFYNKALMGPEANPIGVATTLALVRSGYPHMYWRKKGFDGAEPDTTSRYGFLTNSQTKPMIIDDLVRDIREGTYVTFDEEVVRELRTYGRDDHGKMSGQPFDDCVMATAIANHLRQCVGRGEFRGDDSVPEGSAEWWKRISLAKRRDAEAKERSWRLGNARLYASVGSSVYDA